MNNKEKPKIDNVNNKINVPNYENHAMLLLAQEAWAKPITCSKHLKTWVTEDLFI